MPINADKPHLWKADIERSIDFYNDWFIRFAPETYRTQRIITTEAVLTAFQKTGNLTRIVPEVLQEAPGLLPILRMATAPPLARDRLMGLAYVGKSMIDVMEGKEDVSPRLPKRMSKEELDQNLQRLCDVLAELADTDLLPWLVSAAKPSKQELDRAATVIADRMCGASSDPIIRNAQEKRQLATLRRWLKKNGYKEVKTQDARDPYTMAPGTFAFRLSLPAGTQRSPVKMPIDCVIKTLDAKSREMPVLIEAKSAGDATNTNKRRKEEAQKFRQLKERYGGSVTFLLFLCGYFEAGYLGYEAAEGIDWVWEHRPNDLKALIDTTAGTKKKAEIARETPGPYTPVPLEKKEEERVQAQEQVDCQKNAGERNRLGQFSTPYSLACEIVEASLRLADQTVPITFLEPAAGTGVFYSALLHKAGKDGISSATGCEIDPAHGDIARRLWQPLGFNLIISSFIDFACNPSNFRKFTLLCTNPPYVRHHHLSPEEKIRLQSLVLNRLGLQPSGLSGLYVYFVLMADALLADGAIASWLLPAEFLYVNYGRVLRDYLTSRVTLLSIHHFDPDEVQFDDALVSSCIVTYQKAIPSNSTKCSMSYGGDYTDAQRVKVVKCPQLRRLAKWTMPHFDQDSSLAGGFRIKDGFTVRRGIATGANGFFVIGAETISQYEIPEVFLKPILPSPRIIQGSIIEAAPDGTPKVEGFRYLLDCTASPDEVRRSYPGLWSYLAQGVARGLPEGYLCSKRTVWYFQEKREPALFLASYMGRANGHRACPIRFFLNLSEAVVTNVFLNLYPTFGLASPLRENRSRMIELLDILNAIPADTVLQAGRAYGGGLHKVEPKELLEVRIDDIPNWIQNSVKSQLRLI